MFPVEYVYGDWCGWLANNEAKSADPESPTSPSERCKDTGSQVEGFCIPNSCSEKAILAVLLHLMHRNIGGLILTE